MRRPLPALLGPPQDAYQLQLYGKTFFNTCVVLAGDDRDIDLYHWSSERFSATWRTAVSVLVAKGRARVGVAAAATDWPKRIWDLQFLDHGGDPTTT